MKYATLYDKETTNEIVDMCEATIMFLQRQFEDAESEDCKRVVEDLIDAVIDVKVDITEEVQ